MESFYIGPGGRPDLACHQAQRLAELYRRHGIGANSEVGLRTQKLGTLVNCYLGSGGNWMELSENGTPVRGY